jgi:hypothetical protein
MERLDISGNGNPSAQRRIATNKIVPPQIFPPAVPICQPCCFIDENIARYRR